MELLRGNDNELLPLSLTKNSTVKLALLKSLVAVAACYGLKIVNHESGDVLLDK